MKAAIIKQGGLCAGGIEKYLQQIAVELKRSDWVVDYFYTDSVPCGPHGWIQPGTHPERKAAMEKSGINLFQVECTNIDALESGGKWNNSNLFDIFNASLYDVVIGGHKGEPCWPFSVIKGPRIIETVHGTDFTSGASTYADAYVLISEYQRQRWYNSGGDPKRTHVIAPMVSVDMNFANCNKQEWTIPENKFVFGMHQSPRHGLFSRIPLEAYASIEDDSNFFVILGGEPEYSSQAKSLGLKNFLHIPAVSSSAQINSFLSCLDVYAHGRIDGEVCSSSIIEAMAHSLPVVSHPSTFNNGHASQIDGCGFMARSPQEYASILYNLQKNNELRKNVSGMTKEKYQKFFSYESTKQELLNVITCNLNDTK